MQNSITYNGVSFNADAIFNLGKNEFVKHPHAFWNHLPEEEKQKHLLQVWQIICERYGYIEQLETEIIIDEIEDY